MILLVGILFLATTGVLADCPSKDDSVTSLPNFDGDTLPCMYSGFINVDNSSDSNVFYWLFRNDDESKPLVVWLNGGPGSSSMIGLFLEQGPLQVTEEKAN